MVMLRKPKRKDYCLNHSEMNKVIFLCVILIPIFSCQREAVNKYVSIYGATMGTHYNIIANTSDPILLKNGVVSILKQINYQVNTYDPQSIISRINDLNTQEFQFPKDSMHHFLANYHVSKEIFELSEGLFDATVMPLVNYWGFGFAGRKRVSDVDSNYIIKLLNAVNYNLISVDSESDLVQINKIDPNTQLDFSALAKGYAVDEISRYCEKKGIYNYLVEIGGETRAKGLSNKNQPFVIGINKPDKMAKANEIIQKVQLEDKAIATSGNYRNYYISGDHEFWHSINPKTGFPQKNEMLSASILAEDCIEADALATACMIIGLDASKHLIANLEETGLFAVFVNSKGEVATFADPVFEKIMIK